MMTIDAVVDEDRLRELTEDFGADDVAMVIEAFLEEATEVVDALGADLSDAPSQSRVEKFHFLAGAAHNMGARRFGDLCKQLENGNGAFGDQQYAEFRAEYQQVIGFFAAACAPADQAATG